jgi:hypothetical protein
MLVIARVRPAAHAAHVGDERASPGISLVGLARGRGCRPQRVSTVLGTVAVTTGDDQRRRRIHHHAADARDVQA